MHKISLNKKEFQVEKKTYNRKECARTIDKT